MNFTLNTKVYSGVGFNANNQSVYKYTGAGMPSGFSYLTASVKTGTGTAASTVRYNLSVPHVATEASTCACPGTVISTDYVRIEVSVPSGSTLADRQNILLSIRDLVGTVAFKDSVELLTQPT